MSQAQYIMVEFNGIRKTILEENLPEAQKMADEMYALAIQSGLPKAYAQERFALRIIKNEK